MAADAQPMGKAEPLRFFARTRRVVGWLTLAAGVTTLLALFLGSSAVVFSGLFLLLLYGVWHFLVLVERRETFRLQEEPEAFARREIAAERAEIRTAIGIGVVLLVASVLIVGFALGSKWLGTVALLLFLYVLVIGGPYWLAQVLARGEDARRRPR